MKSEIIRAAVDRILRKFPVIPGPECVQHLAQLAACCEFADKIDAASGELYKRVVYDLAMETLVLIDAWCDLPHDGSIKLKD